MPQTILVTGASGFVGGHLLPQLRAALPGARLLAAAREELVPGWDATVRLNFADPAQLASTIAEIRPSAVLHMAALTAVHASFSDPTGTYRFNVMGTLALADAVLRRAPECRFLFVSSAEVYGLSFQRGVPLAEDAPMAPANPYAASKAAADVALSEMALRGLKLLRLRPFSHTGPGQSDAFVVPAFARQVARIAEGLAPPQVKVGALDRWRDLLDVRDVCAAYVTALQQEDLPPGLALNVTSGGVKRIGDVLQNLLRLAGVEAEIISDPGRMRPTDVARTLGDAGAIATHLGWQPRIPWEQTLADVLADWRQRVHLGAPC